ncbi:zinc finger and BTB domain-containing protein 17-like [Anopheles albimanus]|uniref:zinc finger and BTB domain-containing protein 17-like n=1 Tax=Anopheles albimanus TaxID=7167 RepID=UPI00163EBCD7|nr:zinc finger and BTB domain-containing protein 17-like [Anopheles albimanus]
MGFSDNRGKMSDLNLLPKKHTNFSIERILLKPADGSCLPSAGPARMERIEQKVDLTVKTCIQIVHSDERQLRRPPVATMDDRAGTSAFCTATVTTLTSTAKTAKNVPAAVPHQRPGFSPGTLAIGTSSPTSGALIVAPRPLNRVLDSPWSSRGPFMFDPKLTTATGGHCGSKHSTHSSTVGIGLAGTATATATTSPSTPSPPQSSVFPVTTPPSSSAAPHAPSAPPSSSSLIKTEVERKVVLSAYANNSVIERNRLSINYPYPVGLFNAYASAAAVAAATANVSSAHYHHNQEQQPHQQQHALRLPPAPIPPSVLPSLVTPSLVAIHQQHQQQQQVHHRAAAAALLASTATTPLAASALFSSFYQLQKSDENQNSICDHASADEGSDGTTGASDGGKDSQPELGGTHGHPLHHLHDHHHHHLHYHHPETADAIPGPSSAIPGHTSVCTLMYPDCSFQCAICDKIFGNQDTLMSNDKHNKTPRFECEECGKGFSQLRNYKYHVSVHRGTKEFAAKCPECGKMFNDKGYLSSHLKIHRNKKEYSCPHCPKSFNQRVAFNMHVRIHTGVKPHKCNECGKRFSRKMLLKQHLRTHSGEKPYQCSVCGKSFADRSNMTLHHRLHSGIKPFACPICPKAFTKKHHLKTHLNYHTGYKPYVCPHPNCGQSFTQSSNMRTHAKKCQFKPPNSEFV